ncbi:MAG: hypothetical protein SGILL_001204 [Bacillariaceae sp.]
MEEDMELPAEEEYGEFDDSFVDSESITFRAGRELSGVYTLAWEIEKPKLTVPVGSELFNDHLEMIGEINQLYFQDRLFVEQLLEDALVLTFLKSWQKDGTLTEWTEDATTRSLELTIMRALETRARYVELVAFYLEKMYDSFENRGEKLGYLRRAHDDTALFANYIPDAEFCGYIRMMVQGAEKIITPLFHETQLAERT